MYLDNMFEDNNKPKHWRIGQTIFNFLGYLKSKGVSGEVVNHPETGEPLHSSGAMADPFYISDEELIKHYEDFKKLYNVKNERKTKNNIRKS